MAKGSKDIVANLLTALDNDDVVEKLAKVLSASIALTLQEMAVPLNKKLDKLLADHKLIIDRGAKVETENAKLKETNDGLLEKVNQLHRKVSQLEQTQLQCDVIVHGVKETFAERTEERSDGDAGSRADAVAVACTLFKDACGIFVGPSDIHAAYRLRTKAPGPRPLLVSFTSKALRTAVVTARRPKQTLTFNGSKIYIYDHLTSNSAEIFRKARRLVKDKEASATWTRDGLIFIRWTDNGKPTRVRMLSDLD